MALFERRGKFYYVADRKLIRVTSVLDVLNKPQLVTWAARSAAEIAIAEPSLSVDRIVSGVFQKREMAADLGSDVHNIIDALNQGSKIDLKSISEKKQGYVKAFLSFVEMMNPKTITSEQVCYSKKYGYAGTTDWIAQLPNKEVWLMDFKTGGIYIEAGLQMAAYKNAIHEMIETGELKISKIDKTAVVQLNQDTTFNLRMFDSPFEIFLNILAIYNWYESNK